MSTQIDEKTVEMTVSKRTNVTSLAISISKTIQEGKVVRLVGIGANAINQMNKAAAKSAAYLAPVGRFIVWRIYFIDRPVTPEIQQEITPEDIDPDAIPATPNANGDRKQVLSAIVLQSQAL